MTILIALCESALVLMLIWGACQDAITFRLPNWLTVATAAVALAAIALAAVVSQSPMGIAWHLGFGIAVFLAGLLAFHFNLLGGGDIKWIAAIAIWIGPHLDFLRFIVIMGIAGGVLAGIIFLIRRIRPGYGGNDSGNAHLPYGVAIAAAGLDYTLRRSTISREAFAWALG